MNIFKKFLRREVSFRYTQEQIERRNEFIPKIPREVRDIFWDESEFDNLNYENKIKIIPASIEYLSTKYFKSRDVVPIKKVAKIVKEEEVNEQLDTQPSLSFRDLSKGVDLVENEFLHIDLASEEQVNALGSLQVELYSLLEKIQDINVSSDFKKAYDIQDKISYLLNNRTLLFASLVEKLLVYLQEVIDKLESYYQTIIKKQQKFQFYNRKISEIQDYRYKTDLSMKLIDENREISLKEIERNARILEMF